MADVSVNSAKKKRKGKVSNKEEKQRPNKTRRIHLTESAEAKAEPHRKFQEERPWRNLKLILSLQNREIDLQKKLELAYSFVNSSVEERDAETSEDYETVKTSRLIVFLNDWVQSLIISTEKKVKTDGSKNQSQVIEACLDYRCWVIFKFCLEESLKWHVSLSFSRNLLRAIGAIASSALSLLINSPMTLKESIFVGEGFELYSGVLDCVSLVFNSLGGLSNENLDLWISAMGSVLELVLKIFSENLDGCNAGAFFLQFTCVVLAPFAKFLRVHPTKKNGFRDFIDKLLESLLILLGVLHSRVHESNSHLMKNLLKMVEEVLCQGLFHPIHIDGFLGLHSIDKYLASNDAKQKDSKTIIKSYHRHLFDKLESIMAAKRISVSSAIGRLFHLLVDRIKKLKGATVEASSELERNLSSHMSNDSFGSGNSPAEKRSLSGNLNAEARKSLFEFFVQVMEPLVVEMKRYGEVQLMEGTTLSDTNCTLKSINSLLACFMHEKLYVRTEDITEGACFNFMKEVHGAIRLFASNLLQLSNRDIGNRVQKEMFTCLSKELLVAVGCFLDIEYEVAGDDLVSLWLMMLSYLGTGFSFLEASELSLLTSQILDLGCQLIDLYCELRQVNNTIFALCKAVRLIVSIERDAETSCNEFLLCSNSLPREAYGKAVGLLLYSQEFRLSIHNAIRSIPEGQASGCIRQLTMDISESLNWMKEISPVVDGKEFSGKKLKDCSTRIFYLCSELLGRDLSEIYALVLDSLIVTSGNSNLVGLSLEDLMILIRPCLSNLIKLEPDSINEFLISVTGITSENELTGNKIELIKCGCFTQWILVFFFRLYLSCRSLQRQVISLMPPDTSKKMSAAMGDFFTAYCGKDWMNKIDWADEGYFAWIAQPSTSLLDIIQFYSEIFRKDNVRDCYPLIYVLHAMSLQRLVDLNRQIKSLEYVQLNNDYVVQTLVLDDVDLSQFRKKCRKWKKCISVMNQEAAGLVDFMMKYISLVTDDQIIFINSNDVCCSQKSVQELLGSNEWNLGVSAVVEESLPTALWWVLNQNIDIWCPHANSKKLKKFLSLLVSTSLPYVTSSLSGLGMHKIENAACVKTVNVPQISSEALCDSFLYEHKFVRRHLASRFCHILDQQALSLLSDFSISDVDFSSSPNWEKVLTALENTSMDVVGKKHVINDLFPVTKAMSHSFDKLPKASGMERKASQAIRMKFTVCQSLLNLLCWMPKGCMNSKSSSLYATRILNLERVVVGCLLQFDGALSSHDKNEFFRLFVSCRRSLKYIIVEFSEGKTESSKSSFIPLLFKDPQFLLWLFKSVLLVVGSREVVADDYSHEIREMKFSLLDHTSYTFLTLSKCQFIGTSHTRMLSENPSTQQPRSGIAQELTNIKDTDPCLDSSKDLEAWKSVCCVLQCLEEQTQSLLLPLKDALPGTKIGVCAQIINLEKLSSIFSCFSGILWGIACTLNHTDGSSDRSKLSRLNGEIVSKLNLYMNIFADYISSLLKILVVEDKTSPAMSCNAQSFQDLGYGRNSLSSFELFSENRKADNRSINDNRHEGVKSTRTYSASSEMAVVDDRSLVEDGGCPSSVLPESDSVEFQRLNRHLLRDLLKGDHPETAALLRQLFAAASVILRLNQKIRSKPFSSSLVLTFIDISHVLLVGLADMVEIPPKFTFVWLDGVLLYLEELGGLFPLTNHTSTINLYTKLMELHIRAIGKCISLQGKKATLGSHEIESSTEVFSDNLGSLEVPLPQEILCLNEFKARLRMSFKVFINKPSDPHLLSAIQAIERALLGVQEGCPMFYEIDTGCIDGGNVSSSVAAGIDCLDLILEHVAGRKQLNVVKKHIQNFIAALFNIIVHLRSPVIFCGKPVSIKGDNLPDSGSVILMCIEVLTRVSGKHALFQMDSSHVTQCIRIPASLFQDISHLRFSETSVSSNSFPFMDDQNCSVASLNSFSVDRKFSIDLYAACCRLLYTVLKHNKSDCERCVAVLEESVRLLLQILETVDSDLVAGKGYFSWKVQEGIKCACSLRRIYEELRQQKDVYGQHCFKFLANYIWIYSGFGPRKTGIRREIDEALKPGVYALIDACSADDLQYLHTVFGEGPCRNTLATLQHDYKLNFRYEGKV